jgi:hypothetical protein
MTVRVSTILSLLLVLMGIHQASFAVKMDETTHDQVISRLEMGLESLEKSEPVRTGLLIRLADLYADRARLKAMNEMGANCQNCTGARDDRRRALKLYNEALPSVEKKEQGRTILQIAHMYTLNDQSSKSVELYINILKANRSVYSSEVRGIANSSLGEIHFRRGQFGEALRYYEAARKENIKNRALIEYRIAWCQLNMGHSDRATQTLVRLLRNPELLQTQTTGGQGVDKTFVQDASRDLAKFLARGKVTPKDIALLRDLSPDEMRKSNLHLLGTETDRVGNKNASLVVWAAYVDEGSVEANERLEVQIRVAKIFYDMNKLDLAANAYEKALAIWKQTGCNNNAELCGELKTRARNMVTAWNKAQKKKPTQNLLRTYIAYLSVHTEDTEMWHWGAVTARTMKRHNDAIALFHRAAQQAHADLQKKPGDKSLQNILEGSLLGEIEMAEASRNLKNRENAYNFYLQMNPQGSQAFEVRYQRAQVYYSTNRFQEAFSEFHYLASMPIKDKKDLRIKSADLALDSLVAMKDDQNLQVRSLEYARFFPERKTEYLKISRKATMNIVAANLKSESATNTSAYKVNLVILDQVNLDGADDAEKIKFYKNKILVAQKALALDSVSATSDKLLKIKSLSAADKEWALGQKVWVAEVQLDFGLAYRLSKNMELGHLSPADRHLRLALLAELAGQNPRKHNEAYLAQSNNVRQSNLIRVTLIKNSNSPWMELDKHMRHLKQTPDLLAAITLDTFARFKNFDRAEKILNTTNIERYPAGLTLARHLELREFHRFDRKIRAHRIYGYSESAMQGTIKERLKLLGQSDRQAASYVRRGDWTLQILAMTQLARENRRMYQDILNLPVPRRLDAAQKQQYQAMIKQQSDPYLARAEKLESELNNIWSQGNSVQNLQTAYMTSSPELQKLYRDEIGPLAQTAPSGAKNRLINLLETPYKRPSQKDILLARRELQAAPFDISKAQALRELEAQGGRPAMVVYLDERINQLKKGKSL